jgi:hypothetical protein
MFKFSLAFGIQILTKFLASFYGLKYFLFYNKLDFSNSIATTEENHRLHSEPEISPEVDQKQDAHTETHYVYPAKLHYFLIKTIPKSEQVV